MGRMLQHLLIAGIYYCQKLNVFAELINEKQELDL